MVWAPYWEMIGRWWSWHLTLMHSLLRHYVPFSCLCSINKHKTYCCIVIWHSVLSRMCIFFSFIPFPLFSFCLLFVCFVEEKTIKQSFIWEKEVSTHIFLRTSMTWTTVCMEWHLFNLGYTWVYILFDINTLCRKNLYVDRFMLWFTALQASHPGSQEGASCANAAMVVLFPQPGGPNRTMGLVLDWTTVSFTSAKKVCLKVQPFHLRGKGKSH